MIATQDEPNSNRALTILSLPLEFTQPKTMYYRLEQSRLKLRQRANLSFDI